MTPNEGKLYVLSGPSGIGKGTVCKRLLAERPQLELSISWTTREVRAGEVPEQTYFYRSRQQFDEMIASNGFLEHASIYGASYGTPRDYVLGRMAGGKDVMLEIESQGALQVMHSYKETVSIYFLPPTMRTLRERLFHRGRENEEKAAARFACAYQELDLAKQYRYVLINEDLEATVASMHRIFDGSYVAQGDMDAHIAKLKEEFSNDY